MQTDHECPWPGDDPLYRQYHDHHWGRPEFNSQQLFAKLCLDGQQAGLSWITILRKQPNYESAFANFNPHILSEWGEQEVERLVTNSGIVRSRPKIQSILGNAKAYMKIKEEKGDFSHWLWSFVSHQQIDNQLISMADMPTQSNESVAMAKALKGAGFKFVGPTICYAFMQAVGMVNDHLVTCSCYEACKATDYPW